MADTRISQLNPIAAGDVDATTDQLPIADTSASETKRISPAALVQAAIGDVADGTIPGGKIAADSLTAAQIAPNTIGASELADNAVGTAALADGTVTSLKLATDAVATDSIAFGAVTTDKIATGAVGAAQLQASSVGASQIADGSVGNAELATDAVDARVLGNASVDTAAIVAQAVTTTKLADANVTESKLATGAVTTTKLADLSVTQGKIALGSVGDAQIIGPVGLSKLPNAPTNGVLAGPATGAAATPTYRSLTPADLPLATTTAAGAASFPAGGGLSVTSGAVSINNAAAGSEGPYVYYTSQGLITSSRGLASTDLPEATDVEIGAVKPGSNLSVSADGTLNHTSSQLPAGVGLVKIDTDANGHVVGATTLSAADIPSIPADKISGGTLDLSLIPPGSITRQQLANYALGYIQEAQPPVTPDGPITSLWLQESTGQLRMWNGNSWYPVGFGRLAQENLRWGGLIDAATGLILLLTEQGAAAGLTVNTVLPLANDGLGGVYLAVSTAGMNIGVTPGISYDVGDWVLCVDQVQGWVRIDLATGGGGGGATALDQLVDVTLTSPAQGQVLTYNSATAQWANQYPPAQAVSSVFGRTGAVIAAEGDYTLSLLGDVDLTTTPPGSGNVLRYNGTGWVPASTQSLSPTTTQGDLIQRGAATDQRLGIGGANTVLHVNAGGTLAEWRALASASTAVSGVTRLATTGEAQAGTLSTVAVTPAGLGSTLGVNVTTSLTGDVTGTVSAPINGTTTIATAIAAGAIVDADVNVGAAIAGTKVSPDFGDQDVATTGTVTAASFLLAGGGSIGGSFPQGTRMLFAQTAAPVGWTKDTTQDDKALRVVSGTASEGGDITFTQAFSTTRTPAGSVAGQNSGGAVANHTLTISQIPSHNHGVNDPGHRHVYNARKTNDTAASGARPLTDAVNTDYNTEVGYTGITIQNNGGGQAHSHGFTNPSWTGTFTGSAMNFAVQYVDVIIATKD